MIWVLNLTNSNNFQAPEVVDRRSETQLQVTGNLKFILAYITPRAIILVVSLCTSI